MELIFDRTEADSLLGNEKGRYTYQDLNRVEAAVAELCLLAEKLDVHISLQTKTDWTKPGLFSVDTWPTQTQMQRYLQNVHVLCDALETKQPLPSSMAKLNWESANAIEKALAMTLARVQGIINNYQYSGELIAGEEQIL